MKKIFCAVCIFFSAAFFLNAEQDNGKLFPSRERYSIENIFYGFSGIFDFPNTFYNHNLSAMTGAGGGFSAEIGYNWSGWMLSAEYMRDIWATKNAAFVRLEKSRNNIFQLRIRRVISNKTISKFPEWFSLVPGFGAGMNFMQGDYYATQRDKDLGNYKHIDFHDREGHSFIMRFSMEAAFDIFKNSAFIPFVGVDYNLVFNERIAGGISGYPRISLGFRRYPFKNADRLQRFKKLLDWDQIKVTEKPPMEPHLRALDDGSRVFLVQPGDEYAGERNASQRSDDEDSLLEDGSKDDLYIGKEKDSESQTDEASDDDADKDKDVYYDDSDKKDYLPKEDDDNADDNKLGDIDAAGAIAMPTLKVSTSLEDGFTPDGDGIDDTVDFMFEANGLEYPPESWTVQIVDDAGNVVKTWSGTGDMPEKITWDGITDRGTIVDPGKEYSVITTAVPDARDSARAGIGMVTDAGTFRTGGTAGTGDDNKLDDGAAGAFAMPTLKVSTSLEDGFTPDGDGIDDTVDFMFEANGLEYPPESWTVQIVDDAGNVVKTWSGTGDMPEKITWDGITDRGTIVDPGKEYSVITTAVPDARDSARAGIGMVTDAGTFRTGGTAGTGDDGKPEDGAAGAFAMPTLKVSTSLEDGFTPDGDGIDDTVDFMFEANGLEYPPESWTVQIVDDAGNVVKTWSGTGDMPEKITWDGVTDRGTIVDPGKEYSVITTVVPDARDSARAGIGMVTDAGTFRTGGTAGTGDTGKPEDGVAGAIAMPTLKVSTSLEDGFTPDGDGIDDTVDFMFEANGLEYPPESWTVQIVDDAGNVVKTWSDNNDNVPEKITWDGVTDSGELVSSNTDYTAIISATPDERDTARTGITTVTDVGTFRTGNLKDNGLPDARLLMSYSDGLSPDGDGNKDTVDFTFKTHGLKYAPESWKLEIFDPVDNLVRTWSGTGELPESITWDGTTDDGDIVAALSNYPVILSVVPDARERGQLETGILVDRQVMRTGIITIDETDTLQPDNLPEEPQPVENTTEPETNEQPTDDTPPETDEQPVEDRPDTTEKADTPVSDEPPVEEKPEPKQDEPEPPASDKQPAEDKPEPKQDKPEPPASDKQPAEDKPEPKQDKPEPSASDKQPVEDKQPTEKEPEKEKPIAGTTRKQWRLISVPVYFDPDAATFNLISETNRQSNIRVLNKIAAEIKKYGNSATVIIEGHANNVSNTEREHIEELIPLSQERAEVVRQLLIERGINADHLTAEGVGGVNPHADWTDRRNWWQNRRVEFIISVEE